ncbi:glutathione synthase/RimK-type ligase-like ATP-grasp enzyme [Paraburkholderia sp. WC7.3g]|uniref:RimK family alpha-L-glutamate ligase n=1 Tax=Paraburkholderia podalyriae TaxID=1938811 RepID=A0ABR7PGV4_9BURK|nr:RimK family alpha-L-glutamate ligase [Paraburkholderia podalyriae]MBC8745602.1 RimK family alpha-L-glutamate ligase [Paraburkholderia podalyriae]
MNTVQTELTSDATHPSTHQPLGLAVLLRAATAGNDLTPFGQSLLEHVTHHDDPYALLDLSLVLQLKYEKEAAIAVQAQAIQMRRHYRLKDAQTPGRSVKVLMLKAPGDLMANTPFECLLENADLQIDVVYVDAHPQPDISLPEHDVIFVAACASDENAGVLAQIASLISGTRCQVLNQPERIAHTTRDAAYTLLGTVPGICMAHTVRLPRERVLEAASGAFELSDLLNGHYPFIIRPTGSHAGQGLAKVTDSRELALSVNDSAATEFYVAPFIDYSSTDGLFRKYRIVMIEGKPFVCHMGISKEWMVHYPYAEMLAHPERRDEEAHLMASFDSGFAVRHKEALRMIAELTGLDYVGFDCAETGDDRLLIFEIATAMVVHDMDDPNTFRYKLPQMRRIFDAFDQMLRRTSPKSC